VSDGTSTRYPVDFDAFSTAVALALISGALAVVEPFLLALTAALTGLALAAWVAGHVPRTTVRRPAPRPILGFAFLGAGVAGVFLLPPAVLSARALVLAASLIPLWWIGRISWPYRVRDRAG
jgi:hypothetical protein